MEITQDGAFQVFGRGKLAFASTVLKDGYTLEMEYRRDRSGEPQLYLTRGRVRQIVSSMDDLRKVARVDSTDRALEFCRLRSQLDIVRQLDHPYYLELTNQSIFGYEQAVVLASSRNRLQLQPPEAKRVVGGYEVRRDVVGYSEGSSAEGFIDIVRLTESITDRGGYSIIRRDLHYHGFYREVWRSVIRDLPLL